MSALSYIESVLTLDFKVGCKGIKYLYTKT